MTQVARRHAIVPAIVVAILTLPGCTATDSVRLPDSLSRAHRWQQLGDAQLSALNESALATAPLPEPASGQISLSFEIAGRYIALRARQTALVLLAEREELDSQSVIIARQRVAGAANQRYSASAAAAQLAATRADQVWTRAEITALRQRLAVLTGLAPGMIDSLPGGPIPLPPVLPGMGDPRGMINGNSNYRAAQDGAGPADRYNAARIAAADGQSRAEQARIIAALQTMRVRAGELAPGEARAADRQALDALLAEEQARAAMAQAYIALVGSSPLGRDAARR